MIHDGAVTFVNLIGAILMTSYTICFYYYCSRRLTVQKQVVSAFSFYVTLNLYLTYGESDDETSRYICGIVATAFCIGFFASPLATLALVIRSRSTATLPFYMIIANFIGTAQWFLYGIILEDYFIETPNFLGWCLSVIQLSLFVIYPSVSEEKIAIISYNGARPKDKSFSSIA